MYILDRHERDECPCRQYTCQYCGHNGSYELTTGHHYSECQRYPVTCSTNYCVEGFMFERGDLQYHLENECPLRSVECEYKWAGCHGTLLHEDLHQHNIDFLAHHLTMLHVFCAELQKENDVLARENEALKEELNQVGGKRNSRSKRWSLIQKMKNNES